MGSDTTRSAHGFHRVRDSPQRCGLSWACCPAAFSVRPVCPGPLLPALLPNSMRDSNPPSPAHVRRWRCAAREPDHRAPHLRGNGDRAPRSRGSLSAWVHHGEFARRTEQLVGHLEATLALAEEGRFPSACAVARTALEHHLLDRLLLLRIATRSWCDRPTQSSLRSGSRPGCRRPSSGRGMWCRSSGSGTGERSDSCDSGTSA